METVGPQPLAAELKGFVRGQGMAMAREVGGALMLPAAALRPDNELLVLLPDAHSPMSAGVSLDDRVLGLAVRWIRFGPVVR